MLCPHCKKDTPSKVVETRHYEGDIYRRRKCPCGGKSFITVEKAPPDLDMPVSINQSNRPQIKPRSGDKLWDVW